jgi:hypothetical protein
MEAKFAKGIQFSLANLAEDSVYLLLKTRVKQIDTLKLYNCHQ